MKNGHGGAFERASEYGSGEAAEYAAGSGKEKERGTSVGGEKGGTAEEGAESGRALEAAAEYESDEILVKAAQSGDKQATEELLVRYASVVRGRAPGIFPHRRRDGGSYSGGHGGAVSRHRRLPSRKRRGLKLQKFCLPLRFAADHRRGKGVGEKKERAAPTITSRCFSRNGLCPFPAPRRK